MTTTKAYRDGFTDGHRAVFDNTDPKRPGDPDYMTGWEKGLIEGRADAQFDREQQEFMDWKAGL
jgi:hypothetical protein